MIDVSRVRAHIDAIDGEVVAVPKLQLVEMLAEVEIGQHARRSISSIRGMVAPATINAVAA